MRCTPKSSSNSGTSDPPRTERSHPRSGPDSGQYRGLRCVHTDLHAAHGDWPVKPTQPFIPGHEAIGRVAAVGAGVTLMKEGDRVGVPWLYSACDHCEYCLTAWETVCAQAEFGIYTKNGGFADYLVADPNYVARLPAGLAPNDAAPLGCAGITTYKGIKETGAKPGEWIVISGAVDLGSRRPSLGAFKPGVGMTRKLGTCVLVGLPPGEFSVPLFDEVATASPIRGSFIGTRADMAGALAFAADGMVIADIELQPLSAINGVLDRLDHGDVASRVVLEFSDNRAERPYDDKFASYKGRSLDVRQVEASSFLRTYSFNSERSS